MRRNKPSQWLDKVGMCTSLVCMVHCFAVPVFLILGLDSVLVVIDHEWLETGIIVGSLFIGMIAFLQGYFLHKQHFIPVLFIAGFMLLINGEAVESTLLKATLSILGAMIIGYAHYYNLKLKRYASVS